MYIVIDQNPSNGCEIIKTMLVVEAVLYYG